MDGKSLREAIQSKWGRQWDHRLMTVYLSACIICSRETAMLEPRILRVWFAVTLLMGVILSSGTLSAQ
jgi:hypothetical protein